MSRIDDFLNTLEDYELAFLYKYKFASYMPASREKVLLKIKEKALTEEKMLVLTEMTENKSSNTGCPRCNSIKIIKERSEFWNTRHNRIDVDMAFGQKKYTNKIICAVCDYSIQDRNAKSPSAIREFLNLFKRQNKDDL